MPDALRKQVHHGAVVGAAGAGIRPNITHPPGFLPAGELVPLLAVRPDVPGYLQCRAGRLRVRQTRAVHGQLDAMGLRCTACGVMEDATVQGPCGGSTLPTTGRLCALCKPHLVVNAVWCENCDTVWCSTCLAPADEPWMCPACFNTAQSRFHIVSAVRQAAQEWLRTAARALDREFVFAPAVPAVITALPALPPSPPPLPGTP